MLIFALIDTHEVKEKTEQCTRSINHRILNKAVPRKARASNILEPVVGIELTKKFRYTSETHLSWHLFYSYAKIIPTKETERI